MIQLGYILRYPKSRWMQKFTVVACDTYSQRWSPPGTAWATCLLHAENGGVHAWHLRHSDDVLYFSKNRRLSLIGWGDDLKVILLSSPCPVREGLVWKNKVVLYMANGLREQVSVFRIEKVSKSQQTPQGFKCSICLLRISKILLMHGSQDMNTKSCQWCISIKTLLLRTMYVICSWCAHVFGFKNNNVEQICIFFLLRIT